MRVFTTVFTLAVAGSACDSDPAAVQTEADTEIGIIVSSSDRIATLFPVDSPQSISQLGLAPDGTPVTVAARKRYAVVPLGTFPAVAVIDLSQRSLKATVALPLESGATGVAFINDSVALVANPHRNSITPVNVLRATAGAEIQVGTFPQAIVSVGDTAYVLNSELGADFAPRHTGTVSVVTGPMLRVIATVELTGTNPLAAIAGTDGELYVLNAGSFGAGNGSLSTIDRRTLSETRHDTGFGNFPGALARSADGQLYIGSFGFGVAVWQVATHTFVRSPANAIRPGGIASNSGLGVDAAGRLYALQPDCRAPSRAFRLSASFEIEAEVRTGICPFGIAFTVVPATP